MAQPKYQLLQQWLRDQINSGEYTANQQIPTELELAEQFGYSRQTIRQAISGLEQEGLLKRTPGRGTFVCQQNAGRVNRSESRTRRVGVLTTYLDDYIFPGIINGIERVLSRHGEEDAGDVARRAGRGAEADKAERAGHRNACAEVAVDEQDDDLHHRGQQRERHRHGLRTGVFIHIYRCDERAERQRRDQADGERGGRDAGGQNRTK